MADKFFYIFSYGSNLYLNRIFNRTKSVVVIDTHELIGFKLTFNKKSSDGSNKANITETEDPNDSVWGVIHRLDLSEKLILDQYEGLGYGYNYQKFSLSIKGDEKTIHSYMATDQQYLEKGEPYQWYLNFVIAGTIENGFPESYTNKLKSLLSKKDSNENRTTQNHAILIE